MQQRIKTLSFRVILFLFVTIGLLLGTDAYGQSRVNADSARIARERIQDSTRNAMKASLDSARQARQRILDSTRAANQRILDSSRAERMRISDSMKIARQHITDSLTAIREYRESKHYKDSIATARQERLDSIKAVRTAYYDSVRAERQRVTDSVVAVRKAALDSMRAIQKQRSDSLAAIRKYRESKRYKDSVALVRQMRVDSATAARKAYNDSVIAVRKAALDSATAVRKAKTDSMTAARTRITDSLKAVRKVRADSLAKVKEQREKLKKVAEKKREDKFKLALELKITKKREAWSNEKMLKKKWSFYRRFFQNTYTHYNYYFNADRKMDEALTNMQRMKKENYDTLIPLFPFDPDIDSTALASDMDSIIHKASVGIQIHDPRTKWADDLYLLMGQAYYYKGNYNEATTAFRYIISTNQQRKAKEQKEAAAKKKPVDKEVSIVESDEKKALDFLKHRSVNNEAVLWLARTYTEAHKEEDAEAILDLIETDKNLPDDMKGRLALEKAYLNLGRGNTRMASEHLVAVAADEEMPEWIRLRAAYLVGQLEYEQGNYAVAASHFQSVVDLNPKIEMDFYARKNLAYSLMNAGGSQDAATASLKKMLKDGKYAPYYEQVYYVLGRLAANNNDLDDAAKFLRQSIESPKSTKKQKALSFATLGNVYYAKGNYTDAKLSYDSAAALTRYAPNDELIITAAKRAKVLDRITGPVNIISTQDSLLALASLDEKGQLARVRDYIRDLERRISDSVFRAEGGDPGAIAMGDGGDPGGTWYFANVALVKQGYNDFKRKWGSRQNVDNWRRVGGMAFTNTGGQSTDFNEDEGVDEKGLPTEASLLAAIPNSAEEKTRSRESIQRAYVDLATAYVSDLEDFPRATQALDTLDYRYSNHNHKAEALYLRYQVALKENRLDIAKQLSDQLQRDYSTSPWAARVAPSQESQGLLASTNGISVSNFYDETYGLMMQRDYSTVLTRVREGQKQYKDPVYNNRFRIMEAIALAGEGAYGQADTLLTQFISTNPTDSLRGWAETVMNYIKKNKPAVTAPPAAGDSSAAAKPLPGSMPSPAGAMSTDSLSAAANNAASQPVPATYTYKPKEPHYFMFLFNKMESKAMGVKAGISDFNTFKFSNQNLTSNLQMLQPAQGVIIVKQFASATHAKIYANAVRASKEIFREYNPEEYQLVIISADNFRKLEADKDVQPYLKFFKSVYK